MPAIALLATTLLFWGFYDRYQATGPALLQNPSLDAVARARGDCTGSNGWFRLVVAPGGKTASLNFPIPNGTGADLVRVRGDVKAAGVVSGKYPWSCARLLLVQYDANNKWIPGHHGVVSLDGTEGWSACEDVFEIDPQAARADLVIQQLGSEGAAEFRHLSAEPVRLRVSFIAWQWLFIVLWLAMAALYVKRCRLDRRRLRLLILLNAAAIVFGVLMPEKWIEGTSDYMADETAKIIAKVESGAGGGASVAHAKPKKKSVEPEKKSGMELELNRFNELVGGVHGFGHLALFASLCLLVYLSAALEGQHRSYYFKVAFDILLFAAITESLQYVTLDRRPGLSDWLVDLCGMGLAFLIFLAVKRFVPKPVVPPAV